MTAIKHCPQSEKTASQSTSPRSPPKWAPVVEAVALALRGLPDVLAALRLLLVLAELQRHLLGPRRREPQPQLLSVHGLCAEQKL